MPRSTPHARARTITARLQPSQRDLLSTMLAPSQWESYSAEPPHCQSDVGDFMSDRPTRRVIAVAPMPPEKSAYALARYSRSPDSIENSIKWVHGHSSEKFWEQFYFDYGHASIADL